VFSMRRFRTWCILTLLGDCARRRIESMGIPLPGETILVSLRSTPRQIQR